MSASNGSGGLATNALYYGDCLDWMRRWDDQTVDLIYLDPPFNSSADYNMLYAADGGGDAQFRAFTDTWTWDDAAADRLSTYLGAVARPAHNAVIGLYRMLGECGMLAYLTYMAERLEQCHRLLKPTGSIYLHCDDTAGAYLRALMDAIFDARNLRNEIIWKRTTARSDAQRFGRVHDVILFYGAGEPTWNPQYEPYDKTYVAVKYRYDDGDGRGLYRLSDMAKPAPAWEGGMYDWRGYPHPERGWRHKPETMQRLHDEGRIHYPTCPDGAPDYSRRLSRKRYLSEGRGVAAGDVITDIRPINSQAVERLGYDTQKPVALLRRIIGAASNPGDLVLDPFCGCGTTIDAARSLDRRWAGIDISSFAVDVMLERLGDRTIAVYGIPEDLLSAKRLARDDPFGFETWAINRLAGFVPNTKQVADGGIDGRATLALQPDDWNSRLALAQVKGGKHNASMLRDFCGVTDKTKAAVGCYITLTPVNTHAARSDASGLGKITVSGEPYRRMNLWSVADHFDDRRPALPQMNNPYTGKPMMQGSLF